MLRRDIFFFIYNFSSVNFFLQPFLSVYPPQLCSSIPHPQHPHTSLDLRKSLPVPLREIPPSPFPSPPIVISGMSMSDGIRCCLLIASCGTLIQQRPSSPSLHTPKMFVCCKNQSVKMNIK